MDASDSFRSGDFSSDPRFDPEEAFSLFSRAETEEHVIDAMRRYVSSGERRGPFARAVAEYVRAARTRGEPVERVLAILTTLADRVQDSTRGFAQFEPNELRSLILHGVLLAYFGDSEMRGERPTRRRDD